MTTIEKTPADVIFYWAALLIVFALVGRYGRQAMEWFIMKLYEFFIQHHAL